MEKTLYLYHLEKTLYLEKFHDQGYENLQIGNSSVHGQGVLTIEYMYNINTIKLINNINTIYMTIGFVVYDILAHPNTDCFPSDIHSSKGSFSMKFKTQL